MKRTKRKTTKRLLSIILCMVMLMGASISVMAGGTREYASKTGSAAVKSAYSCGKYYTCRYFGNSTKNKLTVMCYGYRYNRQYAGAVSKKVNQGQSIEQNSGMNSSFPAFKNACNLWKVELSGKKARGIGWVRAN